MTTKDKALALVKQFYPECRDDYQGRRLQIAMATLEQHEAFEKKVSNIVSAYVRGSPQGAECEWQNLKSLIIAKPDPLMEATLQVFPDNPFAKEHSDRIRAALDTLGFEIREKNDG